MSTFIRTWAFSASNYINRTTSHLEKSPWTTGSLSPWGNFGNWRLQRASFARLGKRSRAKLCARAARRGRCQRGSSPRVLVPTFPDHGDRVGNLEQQPVSEQGRIQVGLNRFMMPKRCCPCAADCDGPQDRPPSLTPRGVWVTNEEMPQNFGNLVQKKNRPVKTTDWVHSSTQSCYKLAESTRTDNWPFWTSASLGKTRQATSKALGSPGNN